MTTAALPSLPLVRTATLDLVEKDLVPDLLVRAAVRRVLRDRLRELGEGGVEASADREEAFVRTLRESPITIHTREANEQHYELPPEFFEIVLGPHLKYSCCEFAEGESDFAAALGSAELRMLERTAERARVRDGDRVLEIGCGWGSLTLYLAQRFPRSTIVAVSNSRSQREFILGRARDRGLTNVTVVTGDVAELSFAEHGPFDRVVSVEMFEHARNWSRLLEKVAAAMRPEATLFLHVFTHRAHSYPYEVRGPSDFIASHFFTGGMMPSDHLVYRFDEHLRVHSHWRVSGDHYRKTAEAWLARMDAARVRIEPILERVYGSDDALKWWVRWRLFFIACAELWGHDGGNEWHVSHYLLEKRALGS